jgi:acetyl-CoA carboxylase biotin carboxyl carrier protein
VSINLKELNELLQTISQTDLTELNLETDEFKLNVKKGGQVITTTSSPLLLPPSPVLTSVPTSVVEETIINPVEPSAPAPSPLEKKGKEITSPMVGTFYRAPAPDEAPFVQVGDRISVGQTVCIIEAMKLMNEIESELAGEVIEIVVENGQPIEYGQTLMWIKTA